MRATNYCKLGAEACQQNLGVFWKDKAKLPWTSAFLRSAESVQLFKAFYQGYLKKNEQNNQKKQKYELRLEVQKLSVQLKSN